MRAVWVLPLVGGPVLASCAFLLDFDGLQSGGADASVSTGGKGATAGSSGTGAASNGGTAGSAGGGAGGGGGSGLVGNDSGIGCTDASACDDQDPCTVDVCVIPDAGGSGQCISVGTLVDDGEGPIAA